jgi:hypothetical protein
MSSNKVRVQTEKDLVTQVLLAGVKRLSEADGARQVLESGRFRGGDASIELPDGRVFGKCQRLAMMRMQGLKQAVEETRPLMFAAGFAAEEQAIKELKAGGAQFLSLEEMAALRPTGLQVHSNPSAPDRKTLEHIVRPGVSVFGTPDGVFRLPLEVGSTELGPPAVWEHKMIASVWNARSRRYDARPDSGHLVQIGFYMWMLGLDFGFLQYRNNVEWHLSMLGEQWKKGFEGGTTPEVEYEEREVEVKACVPDGVFKSGPRKGQPKTKWVPTGRTRMQMVPKKILPWAYTYSVFFDRGTGRLCFTCPDLKEPVETQIQEEHYIRAAETMSKFRTWQELPARPQAQHVDGGESFSPCNYCEIRDVCDKWENDLGRWWQEASTHESVVDLHERGDSNG